VPYIVEGTSNENLPETHEVLKRKRYAGRGAGVGGKRADFNKDIRAGVNQAAGVWFNEPGKNFRCDRRDMI
jgi:hypothetical protein